MSEETLLALLEEKGYRREAIRRLDRWYVAKVLGHRRDNKGQIEIRQDQQPETPQTWGQVYRARAWPEWRIAERLKKMAADARANAAKRKRK